VSAPETTWATATCEAGHPLLDKMLRDGWEPVGITSQVAVTAEGGPPRLIVIWGLRRRNKAVVEASADILNKLKRMEGPTQ